MTTELRCPDCGKLMLDTSMCGYCGQYPIKMSSELFSIQNSTARLHHELEGVIDRWIAWHKMSPHDVATVLIILQKHVKEMTLCDMGWKLPTDPKPESGYVVVEGELPGFPRYHFLNVKGFKEPFPWAPPGCKRWFRPRSQDPAMISVLVQAMNDQEVE